MSQNNPTYSYHEIFYIAQPKPKPVFALLSNRTSTMVYTTTTHHPLNSTSQGIERYGHTSYTNLYLNTNSNINSLKQLEEHPQAQEGVSLKL